MLIFTYAKTKSVDIHYGVVYIDLSKTLELILYGMDRVYIAQDERVKIGEKEVTHCKHCTLSLIKMW